MSAGLTGDFLHHRSDCQSSSNLSITVIHALRGGLDTIEIMMIKGSRKNPLSNHTFDSILGEGMVIDGRLKVSGSALIHGVVTGNIEADPNSELVVIGVGETGRVMGDITATQVMIGGVVEGNVLANARLEVMSTATIQGDIHYGALVIDEGAQVIGKMIPLKSS